MCRSVFDNTANSIAFEVVRPRRDLRIELCICVKGGDIWVEGFLGLGTLDVSSIFVSTIFSASIFSISINVTVDDINVKIVKDHIRITTEDKTCFVEHSHIISEFLCSVE